ncbi:5072_t:CDS:10 [Entrophospora sp. SA101]|nr:5072_t:CDS:10 [Entrophospora sp. SA101]
MSKKPIGIAFKPREPYTNRIKRILEDYPDGSQILREILQNSDDAKSTEQIFILDYNNYPSTRLFEPLLSNCKTKNLKLERYQGPALLSKNDTIFDERDFSSLLKLADSEKRDQFDKIGVMGVGFNSIYHITDSPSFITDKKYVILDPHEYYFEGGRVYDFVEDDLQNFYNDQILPFSKPFGNIKFNKPFNGTIFRYPLRTEQDSIDSNISKISYSPKKILEMFENFYQKESVNCLLFLKYIETISFYEFKKGAVKPDLLYKIELKNADEVRSQRRLVVEQIIKQMKIFQDHKQRVDTSISKPAYIAEFSKCVNKKGSKPKIQKWLILNYLDNLYKAEKYFTERFQRNIGEYKFVPNVGLAVCLDDQQALGRLFCFLPLPIDMPFRVSVHGYFAVSTNRRSLPADNEDLAVGSLARLKVGWNQYLFNQVLPSAWVELLHQLCSSHVIYNNSKEFYSLWPLFSSKRSSVNKFCKDILLNVVENIKVEDKVFFSPSKIFDLNSTSSISSHDRNFCWLSISDGYFADESQTQDQGIFEILADLGFLVIKVPSDILTVLKESKNGSSIKFYSPKIVKLFFHERKYLLNDLPRDEILIIFNYILDDDDSDYLDGLKMIPLSDGSLGTISTASSNQGDEDYYYIGPDNDQEILEYDERKVFKNHLAKFIDKGISSELWNKLYNNAETNRHGISNIKILNESVVAKMIESNLVNSVNYNEKYDEIRMHKNDNDQREWIYQLWGNLLYREMFEFKHFENLHILPTNDDNINITLRKLKTIQKCFCYSGRKTESSEEIIIILKSFGLVFVEKEFNENFAPKETRLKKYVFNITDVVAVLNEVDENDKLINLIGTNKQWFLLPTEDEQSYGKIIVPKNKDVFLHVGTDSSDSYRYLLEDVIKIPRLQHVRYWKEFVLPYLEKRNFDEIKLVIKRLFEVSPVLMTNDNEFKEQLSETKFVPSGSILMVQGKAAGDDKIVLSKPKELYDPELLEFFFDDEKLNGFLYELGLKRSLSINDISDRIKSYCGHRKNADNEKLEIVHKKSLSFLKHIDRIWGKKKTHEHKNRPEKSLLSNIVELEWIPTINSKGEIFFSKAKGCRPLDDKELVGLVMPIVEYILENRSLKEIFGWNNYVPIENVIRQMEACSTLTSGNKFYHHRSSICKSVYKYIDDARQGTDEQSRKELRMLKNGFKGRPLIFWEDRFYRPDQVVLKLPKNLQNRDSLIIQLPMEYKNEFKEMFIEMGIRENVELSDFINAIKSINKANNNCTLPSNLLDNVMELLEQISALLSSDSRYKSNNDKNLLDGLLIPNTNIKLVDINVVQFDNMPEADKDNDKSAHPRISLDMAKKLRLKMLNEVFIESVNLPFKSFEQSEPLTVRLKNIIEVTTEFCVFVDDRDFRSVNPGNNPKLISPEMYDWQGPALWIYNNAKFTKEDFQSFLELGVGGKKKDHSKIGRFGLGFNCAYHITDCPSFVSGKYIAFLDPHSKFLPAIGHPPTRQRGNILKFLEKSFGTHFQDQLLPYKGIKNCDFTKEFDGTLFRLPFRTQRLADMSKISNKVEGPDSIVELLSKIEGSREMIFLKNIKSFSVHRITDDDDDVDNPILIWKANIRLPIDLGSIRSTFNNINYARPFELCIEIESNVYECEDTVTSSEKWLICNGEEQKTLDMDLQNLSTGEGLKPRGGVAIFWAQAYEPLDKMHNGIHLEPPKLEGDIYVYLPLPIKTNLNVHLNGEFLVSNDRSSILQFDNNKSTQYGDSEEKIHRWNQHILQEILPTLHVKLLEDIAKRDHKRFIELKGDTSNFNVYTTTHFWPVINNDANFRIDTIYKQYGLKVLRKLIAKNSKIFWTEANGGKFVGAAEALLFDDKEDIDIHLFTQIGTPVVKLEEKKLKHFTMRFGMKFDHQLFDADMVCDLLKHVDKNLLDHQKIFKFLNFILITKAKSYEKLLKLPLVPLCNDDVGDFGESSYFIDQNGECKYLFPSAYSNSKFICSNLPSKLKKIFLEAEFSKTLKINEVDANAILDLIGYELPGRDFHWDPESDSIPNRTWLDRIWKNLMFTDYDYSKFKSYPLLPMTHPSRQLVLPNTEYPLLLIDNEEDLVFKVLTKLKVRFTDMAFPKFANPNLQHFVVEWNFTNVLKAIENVANISHLEIKGLFAQADLSDKDIEVIRLFVKKHFNLYGKSTKKERTFKPILDQLQIWPVHSSIKHNYVAVVDGLLLPKTFQNVSFQVDTNYFLTESDHEYSILVELGAKVVDSYDFLTQDLLPCIPDIPDQDCVQLLINVLLLNDPRIEDYFRYKQSGIPNKTLSEYRKANELYNENVPLFRSIFRESNRFLPDELQNHLQCLNVLRRMDFRNSVNGESLVECAEEILRNIQYEDTPFNVVKQKAEDLLKYFYHNTDLLRRDQLNRFLNIKFVPVAKNLDFPYKETVKSDIYYESLNSICFQRHRDLCWTQVCLIDPIIEPPSSFSISKLGFPKFRQIFNHLCHLSLKSREDNKDWISQYADKHILKSIKEIYTYLNDCLETISDDELQETFQTDEPVFLNSENPFTNSWKSGNQLVFGIREDINNNLCKVKPNLEPYKRLLKASGAKELNDIEPDVKVGEYSQREKLLNGLFDSLAGYPDTHHHDVIFKVGDEETNKMEEIGANRYVLSAASDHFKSMFCGGSKESIEFQKVYVELTDIKPEGFKIFLRWLYGQSLDELIDELAKKKTEVDDYESYYLKLLLGILKYSDMYFIDALKERLEEKILTGHYIEPNNVIEIKQWAEYYRANQLVKGCNQYIMKNEELITMQRNNDIGDADESNEEIEIYLEIDNKIMVGREVIRISNIILNIWVNSIQNGVSIINNYNDSGDEADIKT